MKTQIRSTALKALAACTVLAALACEAAAPVAPGQPPSGFTSAVVQVNGRGMHYVRGGGGPAVILIHGFPEDWAAYQAIMPRLAQRFTVIAVDLPGIGRSAPPIAGYDAAHLAAQVHGLAKSLQLDQPYVVGHDLGGHVTYAYVRSFPQSLRGAMILDVPVPGVAGSDQAGSGMWHVGFMQVPGLAEKLVPVRQDAFLGWFYDLGNFTPEERTYYAQSYGAPQLHTAFEIYRAFPQTAEWSAAQTQENSVPLVVAVGTKSFCNPLLATFVEGFRAKGMKRILSARIADAGHYVLADNPDAVADLIEQHAGSVLDNPTRP